MDPLIRETWNEKERFPCGNRSCHLWLVDPLPQTRRKCIDSLEYAAGKTQRHDAGGAERKGYLGARVAVQCGYGLVARGDEHRLDYKQIVVERYDGVEQGDEDYDVEA